MSNQIDDFADFLAGITPEERATLSGLRDGTLVAVPRPVFAPRFWSSGIGPNEVRYFAVQWPLATKAERDAMLAAAPEATDHG